MIFLEVEIVTEPAPPLGPWRLAVVLAICAIVAVPWWFGVFHICGVI